MKTTITISVSDREQAAIREAVTHYVLGPTITNQNSETIACFLGAVLAKLPPLHAPSSKLQSPSSPLPAPRSYCLKCGERKTGEWCCECNEPTVLKNAELRTLNP